MANKNRISGNELKKSLNLVTIAAAFGLPWFTIVNGPALTGFTRQLGAGDLIFSIIMAMPVIGAVIQVFVSFLVESTGKRKSIFLASGLINRVLWIPIASVPFIIDPNQSKVSIWVVTLLIVISGTGNSITSMAFNSWMGALVPHEVKGRFFGRRTMIYTITGGITALISGRLIDAYPGFSGFAIVFIIAAILGITDITLFFWIKDPKMPQPEDKPVFRKLFSEPYKDKNYLRYILFVAFWYFGVNISGPFFNVYMIEELRMNFLLISLFAQVSANVTTIFSIRIWGRLTDKYGSKPVMQLCCSVLFLLPLMWVFVTPESVWMVLVINLLSGIFWPGFELTALNQSIWLSPEKNRSIYIANYTLIVVVIGTGAAYLSGGAFMELTGKAVEALSIPFLNGQMLSSYHLLFMLSGTIRLLVLLLLFKRYKEENSRRAGDILNDAFRPVKARFLGLH